MINTVYLGLVKRDYIPALIIYFYLVEKMNN